MKVPFRVQRRSEPTAADAWLLLSDQPADVLRLCARLGTPGLPPIYRVAGGFLIPVSRQEGAAEVFHTGIRLRALCPNLYLPADADLLPALAADEARALVRERGLIFLPGGSILAFTPREPVPPGRLLTGGEVRRQAWQALPVPRPRAERIHSITLDLRTNRRCDSGRRRRTTSAARPRPAGSSLPARVTQAGGAAPASSFSSSATCSASSCWPGSEPTG